MNRLQVVLERSWYRFSFLSLVLLPLSVVYGITVALRSVAYRCGLRKRADVGVPVIVIGNLTVGGTGKTPLTIELARCLREKGFSPGVVSRGYKAKAQARSTFVTRELDVSTVGDEPLLIYNEAKCPVVIGHNRSHACRQLISRHSVDVILSDDGLQHLSLGRDLEVVIVDGKRVFGNRLLLPAGPLRESTRRLESVDFIVRHGGTAQPREYTMRSYLQYAINIETGERRELRSFSGREVDAIAGIAHPTEFFERLNELGISTIDHKFSDHHSYIANDVAHLLDKTALMTAKDAVKIRNYAGKDWWSVPQMVELSDSFLEDLIRKLDPTK